MVSRVHVTFGRVLFTGHDTVLCCHHLVDLLVMLSVDEVPYVAFDADAYSGWQ